MIHMKYGPKNITRPPAAPAEINAEAKAKLYAVKVSLGGLVLAEGVVELPSILEAEEPKESAS
jgi:hypothetical protein